MFDINKIALSVALVLAATPAAFAGTLHHSHHATVVHGRVSAAAFGANALAAGQTGRIAETGSMLIQDRDFSSSNGGTYCGGKC